MKKSLIALAALGAFAGVASAQSSVTLFGTVDVALERTKATSAAGVSTTDKTLSNNRQGTSQLSVRGVEDLGGGLKGIFLYEGDFDATQPSGTTHTVGGGGGEIYVGLTGGFGSLKLGTPNTPTLSAQAGRNPFGTKLGGGFASTMGTAHVRQAKSLRYDTPRMGGFTVSVDLADAKQRDIGLNFSGGGFGAWLTMWKDGVTNNKMTTLQASYSFGAVTLMGGYHKESNPDNKGTNLAVKWGLTSQLSLLANYGRQKIDATGNTNKIFAFGPQYLLSKRTSVYARYSKYDVGGSSAGSNTLLTGVQHNF
jgi:predicted porin